MKAIHRLQLVISDLSLTSKRASANRAARPMRSLWRRISMLALLCWPMLAPAQDLAVTRILTPVSGCQLSNAESVSIEIQNLGAPVPGSMIYTLSFQVGNQPSHQEVILRGNPVPSMGTFRHTFNFAGANLLAEGVYTLSASATFAGDLNPANDTLTGVIVENWLPSVGGTTSVPATIAETGFVQLQGQHGAVQAWQVSPDGWRWLSLENETETQAFTNLEAPSAFRAVVKNGRCAEAMSSVQWVSPDSLFKGDFE